MFKIAIGSTSMGKAVLKDCSQYSQITLKTLTLKNITSEMGYGKDSTTLQTNTSEYESF